MHYLVDLMHHGFSQTDPFCILLEENLIISMGNSQSSQMVESILSDLIDHFQIEDFKHLDHGQFYHIFSEKN